MSMDLRDRSAAEIFGADASALIKTKVSAVIQEVGAMHLDVYWRVKESSAIERKYGNNFEGLIADYLGIRVVVLHTGLLNLVAREVKLTMSCKGLVMNEAADYFINPKEGGYRALHIKFRGFDQAVNLGNAKIGVEVQITTAVWSLHSEVSRRLLYHRPEATEVDRLYSEQLAACAESFDDLLKQKFM